MAEATQQGCLKCNVDAALFNQSGTLGFGCVLRNSGGGSVAAAHGVPVGPLVPEVAEALSWIKQEF
ncbi:conserved hypothetical protein [Ricinus communis]|uniref:RNase H type-1 domain-containing protein n=1 Tax=Ricinus communis TaxID=3988 RepID=B9RV96_RICCO|nr:conserved hypothetical protein [Ricinus communis]